MEAEAFPSCSRVSGKLWEALGHLVLGEGA